MNFLTTRGSFVVLGAIALAACGGGGGGSGGETAAGTGTAPVSTPAPTVLERSTAEGLYTGRGDLGFDLAGLVLENGQFYVIYSRSNSIQGVVEGTSTSSNGSFTSTNALDFNIVSLTRTAGTVSATYVPRQTLAGVVTASSQSSRFTATYDASYDTPARVADIAGIFTGQATSSGGPGPFRLTVQADGTLTGSTTLASALCDFTGRLVPRATGKNVFDLTVRFLGPNCALGTATANGVAVPVRQGTRLSLYAVGLLPDRSNGFLGVGSRQ